MFSFGTKAETLNNLYNIRDELGASVLKPVIFTVSEWNKDSEGNWQLICSEFSGVSRVIVRSSAQEEDSEQESLAGKYESIICDNTRDAFFEAVNKVILSFGDSCSDDQILVQEAIEDVDCSGVVFSREPSTGAKYYVINYDDKTGSTSSVTSGNGVETKLYYWIPLKDSYPDDNYLKTVCQTVDKLIQCTDKEELDIEFLFSNGNMYILQVRPLVLKQRSDEKNQLDVLYRIEKMIQQQNMHKPFLYGKRTIYGVMPDWNPAEMIGIHPRNLASSIYKEIITDDVWAYQRDNYGYKKLRSFPLMVDFCGFPYIDVRVSFNSFIPADLDDGIAEKLVDYYLDRLEESPEKHDKVEFDIVFSCYTFDLPKRIRVLEEYGFSRQEIDEIVNSLRNLTKRITNNESGLWKTDAAKLAILEERRKIIEESNLDRISKIFWLLEDCKRYGTLPFAGLARAGFIAVQLLKSMVNEGIITHEENEAFMNDLHTVGSQMRNDYNLMDRETFLKTYGFLRPGTYDICSNRYDESPDKYFDWDSNDRGYISTEKNENFRLSLQQMERIRDTLIKHGMGDNVLGLFSFIKGAIEGRERAKFIFTRNVSDILKLIGEWGEELGFTREDISYSDIQIIKEVYKSSVDEKEVLQQSIDEGKRKYSEGIGIILPPLIVKSSDVFGFFAANSQPNYITQKRVQGEMCKNILQSDVELADKIVLIESADPGYDWIFSHPIKGFITKYGGANSHMAIRAGEYAIPAVIGIGERLYDELFASDIVEIDAANKTIRVLK